MWHFLIGVHSPPQKREERESKLKEQGQLHLIVRREFPNEALLGVNSDKRHGLEPAT